MYDYEKQNELKYDRPFALSLTAFSDNDWVLDWIKYFAPLCYFLVFGIVTSKSKKFSTKFGIQHFPNDTSCEIFEKILI